jgi:hypothetical protein
MKKEEEIPEFNSLEEERKYWEERAKTPGKWTENKPQRRSSFLAVRLNGEEITRLRDAASKQGMSPSSYARHILTKTIEKQAKQTITLDQAWETLAKGLTDEDRSKLEALMKNLAVPNLENPMLFFFNTDAWDDLASTFMRCFFAFQGVTVITPQNKIYEQMKEILNQEPKTQSGGSSAPVKV